MLLSGFNVCAQYTQAEMDAMQKKLQKMRDSVMNDPTIKKFMDQNGNINAAPPQISGSTGSGTGSLPSDTDIEKLILPKMDTARIRLIPKHDFTIEEIATFIDDVHTVLEKKLPPIAVASAKDIAQKLAKDPVEMETVAITGLEKGAYEEAALLITDAARRKPKDAILVANTGAILHRTGLAEKAIPILKTLVRYDPKNALGHNNLGQAYFTLGLIDLALKHLQICISLSPEHPEANNTAGLIELKRGNKQQAQQYFENSIRGGFNIWAYKGLKYIKKEKTRIAPLIKDKVKKPEYFNQFEFHLPAQCYNVKQSKQREEELAEFKKMLAGVLSKFEKAGKAAEQVIRERGGAQYMNRKIMERIKNGQPAVKPFQLLGGMMEAETLLEYRDDKTALEKVDADFNRQYKEYEASYKAEYAALMKQYDYGDDEEECCGEGNISCCDNAEKFCKSANEIKNRYLEKFAALISEWQQRHLHVERQHLDNFLYWSYFSAFDEVDYRVRFYQWIATYLRTLQRISMIKTFEPCNIDEEESERESPEEKSLEEMNCPVSLQIPFGISNLGVVKMSLDCESTSFKVGKGIIFRFEKNHITGQSTLSFGVGEETESWSKGAIGYDTKIHMSVFLLFDKGQITDGGLIAEAKTTFELGFEGAEKIKFKEGIGWRIGYNSGLDLTPGYLKQLIDKTLGPAPELYENKKIRVYTPN